MLKEAKYHITGAQNKVTQEEIPVDEPVFLIRAKDANSFTTLLAYLVECQKTDCNEKHLRDLVYVIHEFNTWQTVNCHLVKFPTS